MQITTNTPGVVAGPVVRICVFGVGGGGSNAISSMKAANVRSAKFIAVNTDLQALSIANADLKLQIGSKVTNGQGAGSNPEKGKESATESAKGIESFIKDADLVFVTAGMGGGTGTGAAPIIAGIAKQLNKLTIGVVTKPFNFEGAAKMQVAEEGIAVLKSNCDAMIVIPNQKLCEVYGDISFGNAFQRSNQVLRQAIQGLSDLILKTQRLNVDFADVRTALSGAGEVHIGIGHGNGDHRAEDAIREASVNKLTDTDITGAKRVIISFSVNDNVDLREIQNAVKCVADVAHPDYKLKFGVDIVPNQKEDIIVTLVASEFVRDNGIHPTAPQVVAPAPSIDVGHQTVVPAQPVVRPSAPKQSNGYIPPSSDGVPDFIRKLHNLSDRKGK